MKKPEILIAEGDGLLRQDLKKCLLRHGFDIFESSNRTDVLGLFQARRPDAVILGSPQNGSWDSLELADEIRRLDRNVPLILITRQSSEERVLAALRAGVNDWFTLPLSWEKLAASVQSNLSSFSRDDSHPPEETSPDPPGAGSMIGISTRMREIKEYLLKVAATDSTVLITGETGTGKELAAEVIHRNSSRSDRPFVAINCAALPENLLESELFGYERGAFTGAVISKQGKFELAEKGTVLLDEIGDMSPFAQAKILRTLEIRETYRLGGKRPIPLDVRVIAATNQDLEALVKEGKFRKDLFYRLNVVRTHLPPLRERKEDIPVLIDHYIRKMNRRFGGRVEGLSKESFNYLLSHDWPGNVRELKNLLEAVFINAPCGTITLMDLPEPFRRECGNEEGITLAERELLLSTLFSTNWNKSKAAQELKWSRMTLYRKMAKYNIHESKVQKQAQENRP